MNRSLDYKLGVQPVAGRNEAKPVYAVALAFLLLTWAVFGLATMVLAVALLVPGHLSLSDLLQALGNLLPADLPNLYGTRIIFGSPAII
jgi:hypothetical protein